MSGSTTPNYNFALPTIGGNQDSWGNLLNANWTAADSAIHTLASGYLPLTGGGAITGSLSVTGNFTAATAAISGGLTAAAVTVGSGGLVVQANASVTGELDVAGPLTVGGNQRVTGSLTVGNSLAVTGNVSATANLFCAGTGVVYSNIGTNGFAFRWNGANAYLRIDNSIEIGIQPLSDERLKADIAPSTFDCLAAVLATPLFQFRWKTLGETPDLETATVAEDAPLVPIGFVAQRQQEVFPASVIPGSETSSGHARATTMWQMDHNALCAALFGAVQQLAEMNEELAARVADLVLLRLEGQS